MVLSTSEDGARRTAHERMMTRRPESDGFWGHEIRLVRISDEFVEQAGYELDFPFDGEDDDDVFSWADEVDGL
jgi:hypothetical protein